MKNTEGLLADRGFQTVEILSVGVTQRMLKILEHSGAAGAFLHGQVPASHGLGHFTLTHISPDYCNIAVQILTHTVQNLLKVSRCTTESGRAEQKDLLTGQVLQKLRDLFIAGAFVGPETDVDRVGIQCLGIGSTVLKAIRSGKSLTDGLGEQGSVAGAAAVYNSVTHFVSFLS